MKTKRRDFLRFSGLAGLSLAGGSILQGATADRNQDNKSVLDQKTHIQHFNMSGYAAPALDIVRIGFIGLGNRGPDHLRQICLLEQVDIKALCDLRPEKINLATKRIKAPDFKPDIYTGEEDWKRVCDRKDIDLIFIATPWALHTPMAVYAMNQGKHVCVEGTGSQNRGRVLATGGNIGAYTQTLHDDGKWLLWVF